MASMKMGLGRLCLDKGEASIDAMMTPYEKLRSLPDPNQHLKPGITFQQLDDIAQVISDNETAIRLNKAKHQLFTSIDEQEQQAA